MYRIKITKADSGFTMFLKQLYHSERAAQRAIEGLKKTTGEMFEFAVVRKEPRSKAV